MAKSLFYLNFKSRLDIGRIQFDAEPIGFDAADFSIIQEDGRMGVDSLFAGGTGKFQFSKKAHPEIFEKLQNVIDVDGYEAVIDLEIDYNSLGNIIIIGNLDVFTSDNNTYGLISLDCILGEDQTRIKKNFEANVDVFSSLDMNGNVIQPVQRKKILLPAMPLKQVSRWESTSVPANARTTVQRNVLNASQILVTRVGANNARVVKSSGINSTLGFFAPETALNNQNGGIPNLETFSFLEFKETATNLKIDFTEIVGTSRQSVIQSILPGASQVSSGSGVISIQVRIGFDMETATVYTLWSKNHNYQRPPAPTSGDSQITPFPESLTFTLPYVERNKRVWIYVNSSGSGQMTSGSGTTSVYTVTGQIVSWKIQASVTLTSYSTINDGVRWIDVVKQVAKNAGQTDVSFPRAELGGYLYNQFCFDGNLLRSLEKPFNITWKDIFQWFGEPHLDYEIQNDGSIFIGNDEDFIPNSELYAVDNIPQDIEYKENFNPEFGLNLFEFKYENYQSQKENDTANTYDVVHGEAQWKSPNINVTGTKEVKVNISRDPFSLEAVRVKAFRTSETTATQDDDKKNMVDVFPKERITEQILSFNETDLLRHEFNEDDNTLTLTNTGTFNFILLGIKQGGSFLITSTPTVQVNNGLFNVVEVASNFVVLSPFGSNNYSASNNGERYTNFTYFINVSDIDGIAWTNQDFTNIQGILNPDNFGNLRFTVGRNIKNWERHLATANLYKSDKPYINTLYKNNPDLITTIYGNTVKEAENFVPANPLLSPKLVSTKFMIRFDKYHELMQKIRSNQRGYIRTFNAFGQPIKLYPKDMKFRQNAGELGTVTLIGKKKQEPSIVNIDTNQSTVFLSLNNGEYQVQRLRYELKNNYFYIKDQNGKLMYDRLTFKQISFNGTVANNQSQLINWLNPISEQ